MTKPIIVVKMPCKLLYVIQVKEFLIKCSTSWPYLISEFLVAYITIVASDWPRTFFTPKVFLFSISYTCIYIYIYIYIYIIKYGSRNQHKKTWHPTFLHLHNTPHNILQPKNQLKCIGNTIITLYLCKTL